MSDSAIAARIIDALQTAADREAEAATALVSVNFDMLARGSDGIITTRLVRKTRTLLFMSAELASAAGVCLVTAASVHKVAS